MAESKKKGDESWDFKVADEHLEQVEIKKKTVRATGKPPSPSDLKKAPKKKKELQIDGVKRKRMSRSAIARRDTALANAKEIMAPTFFKRGMATVIDLAIQGGVWFGADFMKPTLHYHVVKLLEEKGISQTLDPILFDNILAGTVTFVACFLLVYFPAISFKATPGKSMMQIRIGHKVIGDRPSGFMILVREMILKPISMVSVVGLLIGIKNDGNRCLHDMLTNTALYIDD